MEKRNQLAAELVELQTKAAELRTAGDTDALITNSAHISSITAEIRSIDALVTPIVLAPAVTATQARSIVGQIYDNGILQRASKGEYGTIEVRGDIFTGAGGSFDPTATDVFIAPKAQPVVTLLDLLPIVPTDRNTIKTQVETGFVNNAAGVARYVSGDFVTYAESGITVTQIELTMAKVGHILRTDIDTLSDVPAYNDLINRRIVDGVRQALEAQLLSATNVTNSVASLVAGAQTGTYTAATVLDDLRAGILLADEALYPVDFAIVSPAMLAHFDTMKATGTGNYLLGGPLAAAGVNKTLWELNIIKSQFVKNADPLGKIVLGSTKAVTLRVNRALEISTSLNVGTDWAMDAVRTKGSIRAQVEITRPESFVVLTKAA